MMLRLSVRAAALAAACLLGCGSSPSGGPTEPAAEPDPDPVLKPTALVGGRPVTTEIQRRQAAACEQLGPKITACAIADARATMAPDELAKLKLEETAPVHTRKFVESCVEPALSSRQVRVYEVCMREETECAPLLACLEHVNDNVPAATSPAP